MLGQPKNAVKPNAVSSMKPPATAPPQPITHLPQSNHPPKMTTTGAPAPNSGVRFPSSISWNPNANGAGAIPFMYPGHHMAGRPSSFVPPGFIFAPPQTTTLHGVSYTMMPMPPGFIPTNGGPPPQGLAQVPYMSHPMYMKPAAASTRPAQRQTQPNGEKEDKDDSVMISATSNVSSNL